MKIFVVNILINNNPLNFGLYQSLDSLYEDFKYDSNLDEFKKIISDWERNNFIGPIVYRPKKDVIITVDYKLVK